MLQGGGGIGHVLWMVRENNPWTALSWAPEGKRKGQPEETWQHTVEKEQQQLGLRSGAEAITVAPDRAVWRELSPARIHIHLPGQNVGCPHVGCRSLMSLELMLSELNLLVHTAFESSGTAGRLQIWSPDFLSYSPCEEKEMMNKI